MRIIYTLDDKKKADLLSTFLASHGIDNQLEIVTNNDWGSSGYGDTSCRIWVYDEDQVPEALRWVEEFKADPSQQVFKIPGDKIPVITPSEIIQAPPPGNRQQHPNQPKHPIAKFKLSLTLYIILICSILYLVDNSTTPTITHFPSYLPSAPFLDSPLRKETAYDYPQAFTIVDKLKKLYGVEELLTPSELPQEGQYLLEKFQKTPYWQGLYPYYLLHHQLPVLDDPAAPPMFEKIKQGELWRLFTPCLMHNDIIHILFNMIWLLTLGAQIEKRVGGRRYLLLTILIGAFSNTCQYFMSGANFAGYSGILCGLLTFIWVRQKVAAWEGYPLDKSTITFLMIFVVSMFLLQAASFYFESQHQLSISPGIANTAHISGAILGACLGWLPFFNWKHK